MLLLLFVRSTIVNGQKKAFGNKSCVPFFIFFYLRLVTLTFPFLFSSSRIPGPSQSSKQTSSSTVGLCHPLQASLAAQSRRVVYDTTTDDDYSDEDEW